MKLWTLVLLVVVAAVQAQAPLPDARVVADNAFDTQVTNHYGLKVFATRNGGRIVILHNAVWGMDEQNKVRFELFTDGTLHLFNSNQEETITLDGENGQILVRGQRVDNARHKEQ